MEISTDFNLSLRRQSRSIAESVCFKFLSNNGRSHFVEVSLHQPSSSDVKMICFRVLTESRTNSLLIDDWYRPSRRSASLINRVSNESSFCRPSPAIVKSLWSNFFNRQWGNSLFVDHLQRSSTRSVLPFPINHHHRLRRWSDPLCQSSINSLSLSLCRQFSSFVKTA